MTRNEIIEVAKGFYTDNFSEREIAFARLIIEAYRKQQAKQEPVAWMYVNTDGECEQIEYIKDDPMPDDPSVTPLYTAPRQWQGLTDEEIQTAWDSMNHDPAAFVHFAGGALWAEARMKEKNT